MLFDAMASSINVQNMLFLDALQLTANISRSLPGVLRKWNYRTVLKCWFCIWSNRYFIMGAEKCTYHIPETKIGLRLVQN